MTARRDELILLSPPDWPEYALLDTGEGAKLERFGNYTLLRPEKSALWHRALPPNRWQEADAVFEQTEGGEGRWRQRRPIPERWAMRYRDLTFWARLTPFRHTGVFPEQAPQWDWIDAQVRAADKRLNVLNLFGYTGIASMVAAKAGASVTQVDASKPALTWTRDNAMASHLTDKTIRLIPEDALKFTRREARRGRQYDGLIIDPPVFGRGPKGEIWRFWTSFPPLLEACMDILASRPAFVVVTAYAIEESALVLYNLLADCMRSRGGRVTAGELLLKETSAGRSLSAAIYARWSNSAAAGG